MNSLGERRVRLVENGLLALGVIWGGVLRLGWPGVTPFAYDEAQLSRIALNVVRQGHVFTAGMVSSVGIPNLPAAAWLFAIPFAFSSDPLVASLFMGMVSTIALLGIWYLARHWWGRAAGLISLWLAAGSPYLAFYARSIWAQDWLPVLGIAWAMAAWRARERKSAAFLAGFLTGFAWQVHYAGIVLVLAAVFFLVLERKASPRVWMGGFVTALLLAVPALSHIWPALLTLRHGLNAGATTPLDTWQHFLALIDGYNWDWLFIGPTFDVSNGLSAFVTAVAALLLVGSGAAAALKRPLSRERYLLWLWVLSAPLFWSLPRIPHRLHYLLTSVPGAFLLAGGITHIPSRWARRLGVLAAVLIALVQGGLFWRGLDIAGTRFTPGGISTPLLQQRRAARFVQDGSPVVVMAVGDNPETDGDAAVADVLFWEYPHRIVDGRNALILPARPSWLFFVSLWLPSRSILEAVVPPDAIEVHILPKRQGAYPFFVARWHPTRPEGFRPIGPIPFENGLQLVGWQVHPQDKGVRLLTLWRALDPKPQGEIHQFNHMYVEGQEAPIAVHDIPLPWRAWQKGDWVVTWVDFPETMPEGGWLGVGLYRYPSLERIPHLDGAVPTAPIRLGD